MANGVVQITDPSIQVRDVSTRKIGRFISRVAFVATLSVAVSVAGTAAAVPVSDLPDAGALTPFATSENFYNNKLLTIDRETVSLGATTHLTRRIIPMDLSAVRGLFFSATTTLENLNIAHDLSLSGSAGIIGDGANGWRMLVINLHDNWGVDPGAIDHFGDLINGSLLVPGGAVTLARENGAIQSRAKDIALMSGTTVASASCGTKPVPDVGSPLALMTIGLGFLATLKRIFLS